MELARGIEPPTCGLQIRWRGVAQVIDNLGNPHSQPAWSQFASLPDFASLCLNSHPFVCLSNTYLTPGRTTVDRSKTPKHDVLKSRSPQLFCWSANGRMACRTPAIFSNFKI